MNNYQLLIQKLDEFTRKFYLNRLLRGVLYSVAIVGVAFLCINLLEDYFYFGTGVRYALLLGFVGLFLFSFVKYIAVPLLHFYRLGKLISHEQAAKIIGFHFSDVQDKLLNILQLKKNDATLPSSISRELIEASINQKIASLKPVPFSSAINLNENKKYLKYAVPPVVVLVGLLFLAPSLITKPTQRLINPNTYFEKEAPFQFELQNQKLEVLQQNDLALELKMTGKALPDEVFINWQNNDYKMTKKSANTFEYKLTNLQQTADFHFSTGEFHSKPYGVKVIPRPMIIGFDVALNYPAYLNKKNETVANLGDMELPEGTVVTWKFETKNTNEIALHFSDSSKAIANEENKFIVVRRMMKAGQYTLFVSNAQIKNADSITYNIQTIPDLYPNISAQEIKDSLNPRQVYFLGNADDDYGLRSVVFHYQITPEGKSTGDELKTISINNGGVKYVSFTHFFDLNTIGMKPGDVVQYYFECFDNDGVHGSKSARTQVMNFKLPSTNEMEKQVASNNNDILKDMDKALKEARDMKNQLKNLQEKLLQKKSLTYEDKKALQELQAKQQQLEQKIDAMTQKMEENKNNLQQMSQLTPEMQEKMDALKDMMKDLKNDEEKKELEQMAENMDKMNKEEMMDKMKEQQQNSEQKQKELDRMMSLFKQMQLDQKVEKAVKDLQDLAQKQEDLAKKTENAEASKSDELKKEQEDLNKKFQDLKKQLDEIKKEDEQLGDKMKMDEMKDDKDGAEQDQKDASEDLQKEQNSKASKSQKSAAQKMNKMAAKMQQKKEGAEAEQLEMDLRAIRQLLENLVKLSFDQEALMNKVKAANINTPQYLAMMQQQRKLKDDAKMIEDSLYSLGKTVMQIKKFVTEQMTEVNKHQEKTIANLEARSTYMAAGEQQYIMTGANNLALMLSEIMENMQMQQSQSKPGSGSCNKPGGMGSGKPKPGKKSKQLKDVSKMSKEMREALEKMLGQQDGKKPGEKPGDKPGDKPGEKPGGQQPGGQGMNGSGSSNKESKDGKPSNKEGLTSKQFAQLAAQQAALRKALQQLNNEQNKSGGKPLGNLDQLIKDMEKNETDLVNKKITAEMLRRQKDIETRLLEAENAERLQDKDQQRESKVAQEPANVPPPSVAEYLKKRQAAIELYKTVPPNLKPYYKKMVEDYFKDMKVQ